MVEYQERPRRVGTVGLIGNAYHGRDAGFTREVPFCDAEHNNEYKMEWFRRQVHSAGGEVWLGRSVAERSSRATGWLSPW